MKYIPELNQKEFNEWNNRVEDIFVQIKRNNLIINKFINSKNPFKIFNLKKIIELQNSNKELLKVYNSMFDEF